MTTRRRFLQGASVLALAGTIPAIAYYQHTLDTARISGRIIEILDNNLPIPSYKPVWPKARTAEEIEASRYPILATPMPPPYRKPLIPHDPKRVGWNYMHAATESRV